MTLQTIRDFIRPLQPAVLLAFTVGCALVSGVLEVVKPGLGVSFTLGVAGFLRALPGEFYALFGLLGTGYMAARGAGKIFEAKKEGP